MALRAAKCNENTLWAAANLGRSRLLAGLAAWKGGCGQNCPPHGMFSMVPQKQTDPLPHLGGARHSC